MKKKYISPTIYVKYISTEHTLTVWSILIDDTPKPGIQGDAKRATTIQDDSDELEEWGEQEASFY
ncbi:MAG: hypothetical protein MJZ29_02105 [Bacteroidaceae bacterium]|nr:hypothetical protein [Bacteroidaceae bacterium]